MADILKISDATALALHSLVYLAQESDVQRTTADVAAEFDVSRHHLAKVHQRLTHSGLIHSSRGPAGGVMLGRPPEEITLLDVYQVMEGEMGYNACLFGSKSCPQGDCILGTLLPGLGQQVIDYFEKTTLAMLAKESEQKRGTS